MKKNSSFIINTEYSNTLNAINEQSQEYSLNFSYISSFVENYKSYILNKEKFNKYIFGNNLQDALLFAPKEIRAEFEDSELDLELTEHEETDLFLLIETNLPYKEALKKERNLIRNWFFKQDKNVRKFLTIGVE